jgi:hypothetical protein
LDFHPGSDKQSGMVGMAFFCFVRPDKSLGIYTACDSGSVCLYTIQKKKKENRSITIGLIGPSVSETTIQNMQGLGFPKEDHSVIKVFGHI